MTNYVLGFMFNDDGSQVLLIKKNRPQWQAGKLNGVGGKYEEKLDNGYTWAMCREFAEETGVNTSPAAWLPFCTMRGSNSTIYCYKGFNTETFNAAETMESEEICRIHVANLRLQGQEKYVVSNLPWLVALALDKNEAGKSFYTEVRYQ